jgi:hypothetical protein
LTGKARCRSAAADGPASARRLRRSPAIQNWEARRKLFPSGRSQSITRTVTVSGSVVETARWDVSRRGVSTRTPSLRSPYTSRFA